MDRLRLRTEGGFTLIELLVVIAIIGILAAIAIPQFAAYRRRGFDSDAKSAVKNMATAQEAYFVDQNTYSASSLNALTSRGFRQGDNLTVATDGTATTFTAQATIRTGCGSGGVHTFTSSTGQITSTKCD